MTEVVDAIPTLRRRMDAARRLTSSQENVVISSTSSIRNRGKRSRSVSLLSAATKKRLSNGSLEQDLHVSRSSVAMGKVANDMEKETDCTAEIHSLWHWLRQVEKHLYADAWPEDLGNDEASLRQELEHYLVVHGTIENLVARLNQAKDNLSQRNSADLPVDFTVRLRHLETRLHQCWLKSLERQLRLEEEIQRCSLLDFDDPENRSSSSESCLSEPALRCWDWSEWDLVHCASSENMSEEKGVMAGTAGQGLGSLKLALNLSGSGKLELVSQDIGYASESSTLNLSMDDVSPSQPLAPVLGNTGAVSGLIKTLTASPGRVTPAASAHSDTDSSRKADARKLRLPLDPAIRNGSLSASPNEFYYKVAPLILDARAEVLTRSAKGSLSKLRAGPALAFTDDEGESKNFQLLSEITAEVTVDPPKRSSLPADSFTTPPRTLRARTLPPEDRTALLASQCTPQPPETLRRKPRRRRPWSLHLQDPRHGGSPGVSAAVSESALAGQALPGMLRGGRQRRGVVVDWSGSSSEGGLESEEDVEGSRLTVTGRGARGGVKSQSMSALGRRRERGSGEIESSFWDDYQDPPYSSEAYSEKSVDENVVQQITNFGDDFWTILPSGSSSLSVNGERHWSESDGGESSAEELRNVLNESLRQFHIAQTALRGAGHRLRNRCAQLKEIRATCQTNLDWLGTIDKHIAASVDTAENSPLTGEKALIRDLIERWDGLLGEVVRSEACGQWARSVSEALRDIQATVVLLSNAFNPKHPSPLLIRSVQACATIHQQIQTKLSTLDTCTTDTTRLLTRISEHSTSCALCTPTSASLFADAQSLHHHLDTLSQLGRRSLDDVATYQRRLSTVRGRLTTLQSALTSSLPDLVPLHDGEAGGGRDLPGEWREVERLLQQLTGMERFVLLDAEVGEMVKEVKGMLGKMEEDGRECPRRTFLPADKPESHKLEEALPLIPEKTSVLSKPAATTTVRLPDPLLHRDSIVKVKTDILASKWRRTCLLSAPFAGLLIFLCLLAGAFLFQPHCCSYTTQKNLFTITLDYPNGSPPI